VALPAPVAEAVAAAQRAVVAGPVPAGIALAGSREADLDALLALQDAVVFVVDRDANPALVRLARADLAGCPCPVLCVAPAGRPARDLALAGVLAAPSLRSQLLPALEVVR
jgi:hypothetical protein